jgi:hypothetical protein
MFRAGDVVRHESGSEWVVASVSPDNQEFVPAGWPEGIEQASECQFIKRASDDEHRAMLIKVLASTSEGPRWRWAFSNMLNLLPVSTQEEYADLRAETDGLRKEYNYALNVQQAFERRIQSGELLPVG